jgi:hypothetical protein
MRDCLDSGLTGNYLCCDCGKVFDETHPEKVVKRHEAEKHLPEGTRLADVPDEELAERWMLVYDSRGTSFTHPRVWEGKKKRVCRVLKDQECMLDRRELRTKTGLPKKEVIGLLDELVDEGRVVQNGLTWGVPAEQQAVET